MFGLSVMLAVLAFAGAPASTPVSCNPNIVYLPNPSLGPALGVTHFNGTRFPSVELGVTACRALLYSAATPRERAAIRRLNPGIDWPNTQGAGLLVALHEATHVALLSKDECLVERTAFAKIDTLLAKYVPASDVLRAKAGAVVIDAQEKSGVGCAS